MDGQNSRINTDCILVILKKVRSTVISVCIRALLRSILIYDI